MKRFAILPVLLIVAACASNTPAKVLIASCETYGRTLSALSDYKPTMSPARKARIDEIVKYAHPFCDENRPLPVDPGTQIAYLSPVVTELAQLLLAVK